MRSYTPDDYDTIKQWWVDHGWDEDKVVPSHMLPTTGFIIDDVCCAWVYLSANAPMCRLAWPVSNPNASKREVYTGLKAVILRLHEFAVECECPFMEASFSTPSLCKLMKTLDFQTGDTNLTSYFKGL